MLQNSFTEELGSNITVTLQRSISEGSEYSLEDALKVFRDQVNIVDAKSTYDTVAVITDNRTSQMAIDEGAGRGNKYTVYSDVLVKKNALEEWSNLSFDQVAEDAKPEVVSDAVKAKIQEGVESGIQSKLDDGSLSEGGLNTILSDVTADVQTLSSVGGKVRASIAVKNADGSEADVTGLSPLVGSDGGTVFIEVASNSDHSDVNSANGKEADVKLVVGTPVVDNTTGKVLAVSMSLPSASNLIPSPLSSSYSPTERKLSFLFDNTFPVPNSSFGCELIMYNDNGEFVDSKVAVVSKPDADSTLLEFIIDVTDANGGNQANRPSKANLRLTASNGSLWWSKATATKNFAPYVIGTELGSNAETLADGTQYTVNNTEVQFTINNPKLCSPLSVVEVTFTDAEANVWRNTEVPLLVATGSTGAYTLPDKYEDTDGTLTVTYNGAFSDVTTKSEALSILSAYRAVSGDDKAFFKPVLSDIATSDSASGNYGIKVVQGEAVKSTTATLLECTVNGTDVLADCVLTKDTTTDGVWYVDLNGTALNSNTGNTVTVKVVDTDDNAIVVFEAVSGASVSSLVFNTNTDNDVVGVSLTN